MDTALLKVANLSMTFPGLKALDDVSLTVRVGEIVGLLGQNGSGKSTLVKVLAGLYVADAGSQIQLTEGKEGISEIHFIHQDLGLIESLSTVENLDLTRPLGSRGFRPNPVRAERNEARELIAEFGGRFDVDLPLSSLSPAERTIVAIARALSGWTHSSNVLVLDEPTASLHGEEVNLLFTAVRRVAERGAGVVFISHRLDEVMGLVDRVVILRDGRLIADVPRADLHHDDLVKLIAGAMIDVDTGRGQSSVGAPALEINGASGAVLRNLDLTVGSGEIVGVSGSLGSGREELASIIFGASPGSIVSLAVRSRPLTRLGPRAAIRAGVAFVPGDRHRFGAIVQMSARENLTLPRLRPLTRALGWLDARAEVREARSWAAQVGLRPENPEYRFGQFSGGNQQKVVLAKWLRNEPAVLLLDEPTQGVDVGSKAVIFRLIAEAAEAGAGVLICSSDTRELAQTCDRVIVLRDGVVVAEVRRPDLTEAALVSASLGRPRTTDF
ncbi:sugar ABC transporter ATP-binding protein [Glaciihabitans sp. UYNi722]|uniref:sugar ABC transporter ATP-binding protein n=1 Tax=Glaciihabitans sp. UYNi722 TaxID=3156344 RepID=UPI003395F006